MGKALVFVVAAVAILGAAALLYIAGKPECRDGYVPVMSAHYQWYCAAGYAPR